MVSLLDEIEEARIECPCGDADANIQLIVRCRETVYKRVDGKKRRAGVRTLCVAGNKLPHVIYRHRFVSGYISHIDDGSPAAQVRIEDLTMRGWYATAETFKCGCNECWARRKWRGHPEWKASLGDGR